MCTLLTRNALHQCLGYGLGSLDVDSGVSDRWPLRERDVYVRRLFAPQDVRRGKSALPSTRELSGPGKSILDADTSPARTKSRNRARLRQFVENRQSSSSTTVIRVQAGTNVASISARREMNLFGTDVLLVGQTFLGADVLAERLHLWGLQCGYASNLREASDLLSLQPVDHRANPQDASSVVEEIICVRQNERVCVGGPARNC